MRLVEDFRLRADRLRGLGGRIREEWKDNARRASIRDGECSARGSAQREYRRIPCAQVSTDDQKADLQRAALKSAGCKKDAAATQAAHYPNPNRQTNARIDLRASPQTGVRHAAMSGA
jgi:hypothetical protein